MSVSPFLRQSSRSVGWGNFGALPKPPKRASKLVRSLAGRCGNGARGPAGAAGAPRARSVEELANGRRRQRVSLRSALREQAREGFQNLAVLGLDGRTPVLPDL